MSCESENSALTTGMTTEKVIVKAEDDKQTGSVSSILRILK